MTLTLAIILNLVLDTAIVGTVAYAMTHARRLAPHPPPMWLPVARSPGRTGAPHRTFQSRPRLQGALALALD